MTRAYAMTMKRPQETLRLPVSVGRKLCSAGRASGLAFFVIATMACMSMYIYQVNVAASQGFTRRALELKQERLSESVTALEDQLAQRQTIRAVQDRVKGLGYVPVDHVEYIDPSHQGYALAK